MKSPLVIISGFSPELQVEVERMLQGKYTLAIVAPDDLIAFQHLIELAHAAIIIPERWPFLCTPVWKSPYCIPTLAILHQPSAEQVLEAFRVGISEILLWPPKLHDLQLALNKCIRQKASLENSTAKGVAAFLNRFFHPPLYIQHPAAISFDPVAEEILLQEEDPKKQLHAHFFGPFKLHFAHMPCNIPGRKEQELLAYLLLCYPNPVRKGKLAEAMWGIIDPEAARNRLNVTIHRIRKSLDAMESGADWIQFDRDHNTYFLDIPYPLQSDFHTFKAVSSIKKRQEALSEDQLIHHYHKAIALYSGEFLEGFQHSEWIECQRDELRECLQSMLLTVGNYYLKKPTPLQAIPLYRKCLENDACLEHVHQKLMFCYALSGQRDKALRQEHRCEQILWEELRLEPSQRTQELMQDIKQGHRILAEKWLQILSS